MELISFLCAYIMVLFSSCICFLHPKKHRMKTWWTLYSTLTFVCSCLFCCLHKLHIYSPPPCFVIFHSPISSSVRLGRVRWKGLLLMLNLQSALSKLHPFSDVTVEFTVKINIFFLTGYMQMSYIQPYLHICIEYKRMCIKICMPRVHIYIC